MLRLVIIENERPSIDELLRKLNGIHCRFEIVKMIDSVEESIQWFSTRPVNIDLVFMDIHLADGIAFDIFKAVDISTPVIFTTSYDKYLQASLEHNGIDYLIKPINPEKLRQSLKKFENLKQHFTTNLSESQLLSASTNQPASKDRIIVKKGNEYQSIKTEDVAYFYTENKLVFLVDREGKKYMANSGNLTDLIEKLNKKIFYRANRKYIININFIKKYKPFDKVKVEVELSVQSPECVVISQENSGSFRNWIENL